MSKVIVVSGPTGSGKSKLGLELAKVLNGEIISADSVAVYKYFNIGSAKPTEDELASVKHHLVSELEPTDDFSAGLFAKIARENIGQISSQGKLPIVVGGTGLYIRALINGLIPDQREELADNVSWEELNLIDPLSASKIHQNDTTRIRRAFEHFKRLGRSIVEARENLDHTALDADVLILIAERDRAKLYERINLRSEQMLNEGLIEETRELLKHFPETIKPFGAIGYSHVIKYLNGTFSGAEELLTELSQDTRRFAKRQLTWWRNQPKALGWTESKEEPIMSELIDVVRAFLDREKKLGQTAEVVRFVAD